MKTTEARPYRLGLDLGTNSLGWFVAWLDTSGERPRAVGLGPGGVRVFPDGRDPQSGSSNAVDRRTARGMRRRRDRFLGRQRRLMAALVQHGLMPTEESARKALEALDPYELRARALDAPLPAHHVGRALFHLNQRRGFLSNRKAERKDDDKGAITEAATRLESAMAESGARTLGEFLWHKHRNREGVRARARMSGTKATYDFYPTRAVVEAEFEAIWDAQAPHHPAAMTEAARDAIHRTIFFQRPLKVPPVGKCSLDPATESFEKDPEGYRVSWAHPLAQRFRIWQDVRNLEVGETGSPREKLDKEQGDRIALALLQQAKVSFDKMRSLLKLPADARFNLEDEKRDHLKGDETAARLAGSKYFGRRWRSLPLDKQIALVERLLTEENPEHLIVWLEAEVGLDAETAARVADAVLPDGHCRLGLRAIRNILPEMMEAGKNYPDAAKEAGYDHAKAPTGEVLGRLPYYGAWLPDAVVGSGDVRERNEDRYGRFPNPTVHIGLGQLRRLVNGLVKEFGEPQQIVIEFTRALKLSPREKTEVRREQRRNQERNEARAKDLADLGYEAGPRNLLKMRLWEELNPGDPLDRKCPFTGETIGIARLMSEEVEIEHLIPYRLGLDDSAANKVLCMRYANRAKRKLTPFQAFGGNPTIDGFRYDWEAIARRASGLPRNKRWRFDPDAHDKYRDMGGFLGRQIVETGWLARVAKQYLAAVCDPYAIWVVPGRLTSMLRGKWGLNGLLPDHNYGGVQDRDEDFRAATDDMEFSGVKNRADHRHHAIDAFVTAMTDRSLLNRISSVYDEERDKVEMPVPWDGFRDELRIRLDAMVVSHKPDHGPQGKLHEDTAYGLADGARENGSDGKPLGNLVYRKPVESLNDNEIERVRDPGIREMIRDHVYEAKANGMTLADALKDFRDTVRNPDIKDGLRRVRLLKPERPEYLVPVRRRSGGGPYKAYSAGENFCIEIHETPDGRWRGEAIRRFDVNQPGHKSRWRSEHPDARLVMRVHKGDLLRLEHDGRDRVMVVHRLDVAAGRFKLADHNETGNLDRRHAMDGDIDPFRWLMAAYNTLRAAKAEQVRVDPLGRVWRVRPDAEGNPTT
jgi:CRISPR-associated endonuclease Csn1